MQKLKMFICGVVMFICGTVVLLNPDTTLAAFAMVVGVISLAMIIIAANPPGEPVGK